MPRPVIRRLAVAAALLASGGGSPFNSGSEAAVRAAGDDGRAQCRLAAERSAAGELDEALSLFAGALAALEVDAVAGDPELAQCAGGMIEVAAAMGDHQSARRACQIVLDHEVAVHGAGSLEAARARRRLAQAAGDAGDLEAAASLFREALAELEQLSGPNSLEVGAALSGLANVTRKQGDYAEARRLLERSLAITEGQLGPDDPLVAEVLNNLGNVHVGLGDLAGARATYLRVLEIWERSMGPDSPQVGKVLSNLGVVTLNQGDPAAAIPLLERSVAIREQAFGADAPVLGIPLINLGDALLQHGELERAQATLERAAEILARNQGDSSYVTEAINNLGLLLLEQGRGDEAAEAFDRARAVAERSAGHLHPRTAVVIANQARAALFRGQADTAITLALESERIARELLIMTSAALSEREALTFAHQQRESLDLALSFAAASPSDDPALLAATWDALIRSRCLVLEEMALRRALLAGAPEASALIEARAAAAGRLSLLLSTARGSGSEAAIDDARRNLEQAERALGQARTSIERDQGRLRLGLDEVAASMPADACIVAYARFDRSFSGDASRHAGDVERWYLAFTRSPTGALSMLPLANAAEIERLVRGWRAAASHPAGGGAAVELGERLRATVWDPVAARCGEALRIFVVPDGELGLVNLAALPAEADGFLVEQDRLLVMIDQEQDLVRDPLIDAASGPCLLAIGAPDFGNAPDGSLAGTGSPNAGEPGSGRSPAHALGGWRFAPLPGTAIETAEVAAAWTGGSAANTAVRLVGEEASELAFRTLAPGFRVLHLATHGFFLGPDARPPGVAGARGVGGLVAAGSEPPESVGDWAAGLSGLILAGSHRVGESGSEDGLLTTAEIAALDLSGVEWTVLSACDSGVGEASNQEGVFGLRRAFRIAGARTVIMSLWAVDDRAAQEWMAALYHARLVDRSSTAEAVRRASLDVLAARRARGESVHPASWAAFIASGDWR